MQPQVFPPEPPRQRSAAMMMTIGRLKPGVTINEAAAADARARVAARRRTSRSRTITTRAAVVPIWQSPFGAQTYMLPAIGVLGGDGPVDPAGGLRQRRQPRAGPRRQPPRRAGGAAGARRQPRRGCCACCSSRTWCWPSPAHSAASRSPSVLLPFVASGAAAQRAGARLPRHLGRWLCADVRDRAVVRSARSCSASCRR